MKIELSTKCDIQPNEYQVRRNTIDEIELVNTETGKAVSFNKDEHHLKIEPYRR